MYHLVMTAPPAALPWTKDLVATEPIGAGDVFIAPRGTLVDANHHTLIEGLKACTDRTAVAIWASVQNAMYLSANVTIRDVEGTSNQSVTANVPIVAGEKIVAQGAADVWCSAVLADAKAPPEAKYTAAYIMAHLGYVPAPPGSEKLRGYPGIHAVATDKKSADLFLVSGDPAKIKAFDEQGMPDGWGETMAGWLEVFGFIKPDSESSWSMWVNLAEGLGLLQPC